MASFGSLKSAVFNREERKQQYQSHIRGLNAYDRHKKFLNDYVNFYGKGNSTIEKLPIKTDRDTLREGYRFIRSEEDDMDASWEQRLVKRYYDKLFKELFEDIALLICHTTRLARITKCFGTIGVPWKVATYARVHCAELIGLRWRTEKEVISGKGQFICGNKHCDVKDGLASYEASVYTSSNNLISLKFVNFSYFEAGENKQALVKLILCESFNCPKNPTTWLCEMCCALAALLLQIWDLNNAKAHGPPFRELLEVDDDLDNEGSEKKKRGKKPTTSGGNEKTDDDDNFDEFLEGMFP
ncbi:hypothetical protein SADUNF_Sadunf16G0152700 [Salix dunnii]|uniref:Uncharacterized protein n=1 Tax=Salix dunnii TaxID=1413687 RepID=A0A835J6Y4_9ROSI|nr:hypothetical protein SADUNF_Sadunf16G0152700 [Salix dunnii]